ncbi:MAG: sulfate transporter family protein [Hyphomicrobiales bacterium]
MPLVIFALNHYFRHRFNHLDLLMFSAASKAFSQLLSPPFRNVLFKALGLTVVLFVLLAVGVQFGLAAFTFSSTQWIETTASWFAGIGVMALYLVLGFYLMGPVTAVFAGLFMDDVAERVEQKYYPDDNPGSSVPLAPSMLMALQFAFLVLIVHILMLPFLFIGIGAIGLFLANAYLLGREYFEMTGMRHLPSREAKALRKRNAGRVFAAGMLPAALAFIPLGNLIMPIFTTAYMTHIYKIVARDDAV